MLIDVHAHQIPRKYNETIAPGRIPEAKGAPDGWPIPRP